MLWILLFPLVITNIAAGDNSTLKYRRMSESFSTKQNRLLSFNTEEDGKIHVELEFSVPFLSIPVKPTAGLVNGAMANINVGAIVLAGMMAFGAAIVVPATYSLFNKHNSFQRERSDEEASAFWTTITKVERALSENNIDSTTCAQRVLCWMVKEAQENVQNGIASSTDSIINAMVKNEWLGQIADGSVFKDAIDNGLNDINCTEKYYECSIDDEAIRLLGKNVIKMINNKK